MDHITRILEKLNLGRSDQQVTLADIMPLSVAEVRNKAGNRLSREEAQLLQRAAVKEKQNNILFAARALTRANPLLRKEMGAARHHGTAPYGFNDITMPRADEFAAPGAVSSMFSPAGYLTELYREARNLHQKDSAGNLDQRRPDLAKLVLSQENLDKEVSTLALANDQLESALIQVTETSDKIKFYEYLSTSRHSGVTPYNAPFERVREALIQQSFSLPDSILTKGAESAARLALAAGISPELYAILTETIDGSDKTTEELLKKNFPGVNPESLMNLDALANYYELPRDDIQALPEANIAMPGKTALPAWPESGSGKWIAKTPDGKTQAHYIDLVPQNKNQFLVNFSMVDAWSKESTLRIGTHGGDSSDLYSKDNFIPQAGQHCSIEITLDAKRLSQGVEIGISRKEPGTGSFLYTSASFIDTAPQLLALNKTLRLAKACGISPLETQRILTRLRFSEDETDTTVLHHVCEALHYRKRYCIDTEMALMLCNTDISSVSYDGQPSQFDRLFNNPPLNDVTYTLGGDRIPMKPDAQDPRRDVLKRAFRVDNAELWSLHNINYHGNTADIAIDNTLDNLNGLCLTRILADTHGFTVTQLYDLLFISKFKLTNILNITDLVRRELITFLYQTTQWLNTQNISVEQLFLLLTTDAPAVPTKEMNTLLDALRNGGIVSTDADTLRTTMAPVIAAAMQMESPEQAEALLRWLDNNHPDNVPVTNAIWPLITTEKPSADQQKKIAAWCQALAQRVLVIRTFTFSAAELQVLSQGAPANSIAALREISDFHNLINRCGEHAGTVLDALQSSTLTVAILAKALNISEYVITSALTQAGQKPELTTWQPLATLPSRLDLADNLHITPKEITNLLTVSENASPSYADLTTLAGLLQAGLTEQQTQQLHNTLDVRVSEALSGEYRGKLTGKPVSDRNEIWRQLLIDGKVSAAITTTRLADAIAGIQLYINRTIAGDEPDADVAVLERQFFKDWDTYNKRYSSWAGVSQLVYYPENTIDPTIRIGQTGMMNTMLEQLSQSELNSDTLEDGFRQYLTAFEQVANLTVVSGYHDAVDINEGNTWFIGTSQTEPKKYYWRKADHSKCQNGRFAANAWSDWKEIACAINPYKDMMRPVIFRSRLYLLWVEEQVRKDDEGKKDISSFTLKLTHIKYDGSWASPFSYDITDYYINISNGIYGKGFLCTENNEDETLTIAFYTKKEKYNFTTEIKDDVPPAKDDEYFGLNIAADMTYSVTLGIRTVLYYSTNQLDSTNILNINNKMKGKYTSEIIPQPQQGEKHHIIEVHPEYNRIGIIGNKRQLQLKTDIQLSTIPDIVQVPLRKTFCSLFFGKKCLSYYPKRIDYQPSNANFPAGEAIGYLINTTDNDGSMYLSVLFSIPAGDISSIRDDLILKLDNNASEVAPGDLKWISSDKKNHYFYTTFTTRISVGNNKIFSIYDKNTQKKYATINMSDTQDYITLYENFYYLEMSFYHKGVQIKEDFGPQIGFEISHTDNTVIYSHKIPTQNIDVTDYISDRKLDITLSIISQEKGNAESRDFLLSFEEPEINTRNISLNTTAGGAQYMEWDAYRTRLNTLFARQLIERANNGIEAVLSPETQNLREPKPGQGTYVTLTLTPYDKAIHGSNRKFTIFNNNALHAGEYFPVYSGTLSTQNNTSVTLFMPWLDNAYLPEYQIYLRAQYQSGDTHWIRLNCKKIDDNPHGWFLDKTHEYDSFPGLESVSGLSQPDEPMDFSGANALYFWELFYYTPMMVAMRLLQEQNFTEANRWLSYIWQPATSGAGDWRVRPLKEDTSWNADPLDSVDPDAVAQNDPMHYKVSTLMKLIDLLVARGDSAYRMLERDTLNEAKMWYMQALGLLGEKSLTIISSGWGNPALSDAANKTQAKQYHDEISRIRSGGLPPEIRTSNTLTGLFLPQQNEKLLGYWQTLEMRLFNLRNNLSIDGQPLSLPIFAAPADPAALLSAAAAAAGGSKALPSAVIPAMRFPQALESARSLTGQLMQFGSTLQGLIERRDAESMSELLQNQAGELMLSSLRMQEQTLAELDAEKKTLEQSRTGAQSRFESYRTLYDENVSAAEKRTMDLYLSSSVLSTSVEALAMAEAVADLVPNVYGLAVGGSRWGGIPKAIGSGIALAASATKITADNISQSEAWRRRRQEWEIQKNSAESEVKQIDAQLESLTVRRTATEMQREHLEIQQAQTQAQLEFLQRKFSNKALYSWLHGRLAAIYYRFYDLTASRCMMAEAAFTWQTLETTRYIKTGAWQSSHAGLMAGESLLLNLAEMEQAWLKWDRRALEVTRTVSLAEVYSAEKVDLAGNIAELLKGSGSGSTPALTGLSMTADKQLHAAFNLNALNIAGDYPAGLGNTRRIKQISVTLPALVGPYQDVRAVLSYGGDMKLPDGCKAIAVSHGMNDSGQFQLDFNDGHWLPFEGIAVNDNNSLTLSFPGATDDKQKTLLLSLSDIIVHIRYTIR